MARVNTKFVLLLVLAIVFTAGIVGGLWLLQLRGDTGRHIAMGDKFMQEGAYREAYGAYGRAARREPESLSHIEKFESALLKIRPESRDEARKMYGERIAALQQRVRYYKSDAVHHLALLEELEYAAQLASGEFWWQEVEDAAQTMLDELDPADPARPQGYYYRGLALASRTMLLSDIELQDKVTRMGIEAETIVEDDLLQYLEANPDSDSGWGALIRAQLAMSERVRGEARSTVTEDWRTKVRQTVAKARQSAPDGPQVARALLIYALMSKSWNPDAVPDEEITAAGDHLVGVARASGDGRLIASTAELLSTMGWLGFLPPAIDLVQEYVDANPEAYLHRVMLARLQMLDNRLDEASATAEFLMDADLLPVGFISQYQEQIQQRAASTLAHIAHRRWEQADDADKDAALAEVVTAIDRFEGLLTDPENNPMYQFAQAKLAYARKDYRTAAQKFDALVRGGEARSYEVLRYTALSLESAGSPGLAYERVQQIAEFRPSDTTVLYEAARLAYTIRRFVEAQQWADKLLEIDPEHQNGRRISSLVAIELSGGVGTELDATGQAIADADAAMRNGDMVTAVATLEAALSQDPENPQLLDGLVQVHLAAGTPDAAKPHLATLLELQPTNTRLRMLDAQINTSDPLEMVERYVDTLGLDEGEREVALLLRFNAVANAQNAEADRLEAEGSAAEATQARQYATAATAAAERHLAEAERLVPDNAQLLEHKLRKAILVENWTTAETLVDKARQTNADLADGLLFAGELALIREQNEDAITLLEQATVKVPHSSYAHRTLATAFEGVGNLGRARDAYAKAYLANPNDLVTVRRYVSLLTRIGEDTPALRVLRTARRLVPNDANLREAWLELEARAGDPVVVLRERMKIYELRPDDRTNAARLATFLARTEPTRGLMIDDEGEPRYTEGRWLSMSTAARARAVAEVAAEWQTRCDEILAGMGESGETLDVVALRAIVLRESGDVEGGEKLLVEHIEGLDESEMTVEAMLVLARYQYEAGRREEALASIDRGRRYQDPVLREADMVAGEQLFDMGRFRESIAAYQRATELNPEGYAERRIIEAHLRLLEFETAEQLLEARMGAGHDGYFEQMLASAIADAWANKLLLEGKDAEAQRQLRIRDTALEAAKTAMPSNPHPHIQRALALLRAFQRQLAAAPADQVERLRLESKLPDDALRELERADELRSGIPQTSLTRVQVLRARNDIDGAVGELMRLLERSPDQHAARTQLVQLLYAQGNVVLAIEKLQEGINRNPVRPDWPELAADLLLDQVMRSGRGQSVTQDYRISDMRAQAVEAYARALELAPTNSLVTKLASAYLVTEPKDPRAAVELLQEHRQRVDDDPALQVLYALALHHSGNAEGAKQALDVAYANFKAGTASTWAWFGAAKQIFEGRSLEELELYVMQLCGSQPSVEDLRWLARIWASSDEPDRLSRALVHIQTALSMPMPEGRLKALVSYDFSGYLLADKQFQAALDALEPVLEVDPDNKLALNNYVYIMSEHLNRPSDAMPQADRLLGLMSGSDSPGLQATILDTVGWVYFLDDRLREAERLCRRAVDIQPSANNLLHLAAVLHASGNDQAAETRLQQAAESNPDPDTQREIQRLSDDIRTGTRRGE